MSAEMNDKVKIRTVISREFQLLLKISQTMELQCYVIEDRENIPVAIIKKIISKSDNNQLTFTGVEASVLQSVPMLVSCDRDLFQIPKGIHLHLPNLVHLNVYGCRIGSVTREDLKGLEKLTYLSMGDNELTTLPSDLFVGFKDLESIDLSSNDIDALSSEVFRPIAECLQAVDLNYNSGMHIFFRRHGFTAYTMSEFFQDLDRNYNSYLNHKKSDSFESFIPVRPRNYRRRILESSS